jgi:CheY-like chemotaxis protein
MTLKGGGFEVSLKEKQNEARAALVAATISQPEEGATPISAANAAKDAAQAVEGVNARALRRIEGSQVLWVDDRPNNNNYERHALEALGIKFVISTSTDDALSKLKLQHFDTIISDMGRPPDAQAGYTLLDELRSSGNQSHSLSMRARVRQNISWKQDAGARLVARIIRPSFSRWSCRLCSGGSAKIMSPCSVRESYPVTKPLSRSAAIAAGSRWVGSPQPPPPPDSSTSTSPGRISMPVSLVLIGRGGRPSE